MNKKISNLGFTLIELLITLILIGILAAMSIPSYISSLENGKADDAVALVNMIGTTNRMFAIDHNGQYVNGAFSASPCGAMACPAAAPYNNACYLVACKYIADQQWLGKPYTYTACQPGGGGPCGATDVAVAQRTAGGPAMSTNWGYHINSLGTITASGGAPAPSY